jgi:hypothetical protein
LAGSVVLAVASSVVQVRTTWPTVLVVNSPSVTVKKDVAVGVLLASSRSW